jgi:DNA polymerase-3 subunit chi
VSGAEPCEVWFYHLERSALDQVLPELLEKTLARGWRALVRSEDPELLTRLDERLWIYRDEAFLPHGLASEPLPDRQPVLLSTDGANLNSAEALFVVDGEPGDLSGFARCILIFDGASEEAVAQARGVWTRTKAAGHPVTYWRQGESRGWVKQG